MTGESPGPRPARRWLRPALGAVVAAAFLYLTVRRLEWAEIRDAWRTVALGPIALGIAAFAGGYAVRIGRWWLMLRTLNPRLPYRSCVGPFLGSVAVNNTVPLRAGDVLRAVGFRGVLGVPPAQVVGTLVVERVLDMSMLLAIFFIGIVGVARGAVPPAFVTAGSVLFAGCLVGLLTLVVAPRWVERVVARVLLGPLARWPWAARLHGAVEQFFGTLTQLLTPGRAATLIALSALGWGLEGGLYVGVAAALDTGGGAFGPMFALSTGALATLLPSSPGFVGTFDYFAILGITAYGASRGGAAAFALLVHFLIWILPTVAGAACLISLRGARGRAPQPGGRDANAAAWHQADAAEVT